MALDLSPQVFSILSGLIEEKVGLFYGLLDRQILQDKVSTRAQEIGYESLLDYYYFLKYDEAGLQELNELVESLVVNETYFFREWQAIDVLVHQHLKPMIESGKRPRIWCAACSTGEEPLSLAMLLKENNLLDKVQIIASDISENALNKAKAGRFGRRSIRQVPAQHLFEKFITQEDSFYRVSPDILDSVQWNKINVLNPQEYPSDPNFDVIICRNLLIYFSDATVKTVLKQFGEKLSDDGILLVGISESLLRFGSNFVGEEHGGYFFYKKAREI